MHHKLSLLICLMAVPLLLTAQDPFTDVSPLAGHPTRSGAEGISVADYDGDGWEDIYVGYTDGRNELWRNNGDGTFSEVAMAAGVAGADNLRTKVIAWGDFDNDGDPDLYLGNREVADQYFVNNGDGTFTEATEAAGFGQIGRPISLNLADVDRDGWLDLYVTNFLQDNILYRNNGDGTFSDITASAGVSDPSLSMGTLFFDYDLDGDADLYLVHDNNVPNILYRNDGDGTFTNVSAASGANTASFGMGVDAADLDGNGWPDLYITNLYGNFLLLNNGDGTFSEVGEQAGVNDFGMGWGTNLLDYDGDGHVDIYVANEYGFSPYPNVLYRNSGQGFFLPQPASVVANAFSTYGSAVLDLDRDGRPDLAAGNRRNTEYWQLFLNEGNTTNRISLNLTGTTSNRDAIGARVRLVDNLGRVHTDEVHGGQGWTSQSSKQLFFGLGEATGVDSLVVEWPSGMGQTFTGLAANERYVLEEGLIPEGAPFEDLLNSTTERPLPPAVAVYPNPAGPELKVSVGPAEQVLSVRILRADGLELRRWRYDQGVSSVVVGMSNLPAGMYLIGVMTERGEIVKKIAKH